MVELYIERCRDCNSQYDLSGVTASNREEVQGLLDKKLERVGSSSYGSLFPVLKKVCEECDHGEENTIVGRLEMIKNILKEGE
jgi:hypothetical protein